MGIISNLYKNMFVGRYDKDVGVPYYSYIDFKGLKNEEYTFTNSKGINIHYFYYCYDNYNKDKTILFLPGIGPGHTAYMKEIEELANRGYRVLSLDYTGCDKSEGKILGSLNTPTNDVMELLDFLKLNNEIIVIGHSMGGYTALNILNLRKEINKGIIISGFLSIPSLINHSVKSKFIASRINKYERKIFKEYFDLDNRRFLETSEKNILFIHSKDDPIVPYDSSMKIVEEMNKEKFKTLLVDGRGHNPNYTENAAAYLKEVFDKYNLLIKKKEIKTDEDKINYFKDVSLSRLVEQDKEVFKEINSFLK